MQRLPAPRRFFMGPDFLGRSAVPLAMARPRRTALGEAPQGSQIEAFRARGAIIQVRVGNASAVLARLKAEGKNPPPSELINAMIDTGASISAIDVSVAQRLGLVQTGSVQVGGVGGMSTQPVFAAALELSDPAVAYDPLTLSGAQVGAPDFSMLIGRNILCKMVLTYDGPRGGFTLVRAP